MKKIIEARFDDETDAQKAIDILAQHNFDISSAAIFSGGKSLSEQTYDNTYNHIIGSSSGFVYNINEQNEPSSNETYPISTPTVIVAHRLGMSNYTYGANSGSDVPDLKIDSDNYATILTLNAVRDKASEISSLLYSCKASSVNIK